MGLLFVCGGGEMGGEKGKGGAERVKHMEREKKVPRTCNFQKVRRDSLVISGIVKV